MVGYGGARSESAIGDSKYRSEIRNVLIKLAIYLPRSTRLADQVNEGRFLQHRSVFLEAATFRVYECSISREHCNALAVILRMIIPASGQLSAEIALTFLLLLLFANGSQTPGSATAGSDWAHLR